MLIGLLSCVSPSGDPGPDAARDSVESRGDSSGSYLGLQTAGGPRNPHRRTWLDVEVGSQQACGHNPDRSLTCWGDGNNTPVSGVEDVVEFGVGSLVTCVTHAEGVPWCYYANVSQGPLSVTGATGLVVDWSVGCWSDSDQGAGCEYYYLPPSGDLGLEDVPSGEYVAIDVDSYGACGALEGGGLECWGDLELADAERPEGVFTAVAVGDFHACALTDTGAIECWGGTGDAAEDLLLEPPEGEFIDLDMQGRHTACAVRVDGTPMCWGPANESGTNDPPQHIRLKSVNIGDSVCGVTVSDEITCWGYPYSGVVDVPE